MKKIKSIMFVFVAMSFLVGCTSVCKKEKFVDMSFDRTKHLAVEEIFQLDEDYYYVTIKAPDGKLRSYYINITFTLRWYRNLYEPEAEIFDFELKERIIK